VLELGLAVLEEERVVGAWFEVLGLRVCRLGLGLTYLLERWRRKNCPKLILSLALSRSLALCLSLSRSLSRSLSLSLFPPVLELGLAVLEEERVVAREVQGVEPGVGCRV